MDHDPIRNLKRPLEENENSKGSPENNSTKDTCTSSSSSNTSMYSYSTNTTSTRGKPNSQLTKEEKQARVHLKKKVKVQQIVNSLYSKIRHAQARFDANAEANAKKSLDDLLIKEQAIIQEMKFDLDNNDQTKQQENIIIALKANAKPLILQISIPLFASSSAQNALLGGTKETQMENAGKLLRHMTAGTQEQSMFRDEAALWGYTRHKFFERAMLLCVSLGRIRVEDGDNGDGCGCGDRDRDREAGADVYGEERRERMKQMEVRKRAWRIIQNGGLRKACSIGCGPGNDAAGLISFLRMTLANDGNALEDVLLLDWSIEEWKEVIAPLDDILRNKGFVGNAGVKTSFCDVTRDLDHESNSDAREEICRTTSSMAEKTQGQSNYDIYLISYLLSETRGKWESFFQSLVSAAKSGSMFYFAEPMPWQLHRFIELFQDELDFVWVDSSMDRPMLQKAERRAGPSVLFAIKR